ncbi:MAG: UDP-3-O-acyl-N-acetylglucosamine deacetylase [Bacteroidales bacterium]|nr:UDP-3-O-acyl-N-acetylglucosamine deacetylase [Bacteroidales bacterium]
MKDCQHTLRREYEFAGKGLHTGKVANMTICPAPVDYGLRFIRTDIDPNVEIEAIATNVSNTARSTTISCGDSSVTTIEHILSALTGLNIDNARICIDNEEVPILDGSAKPYIEAISKDGIENQDAPRRYVEISEPLEFRNDAGSWIRITPSDTVSFDLTIDFDSKVIGIQSAHCDDGLNYCKEIGMCRTFVFFHELEYLFNKGFARGGDLSNAIVVVEHPVTDEQIERLAELFNHEKLRVSEGYLSNVKPYFPNECARHKLLDLIGDLRLAGGFIKAKVEAFKSGHTINTNAAKGIYESKKQ